MFSDHLYPILIPWMYRLLLLSRGTEALPLPEKGTPSLHACRGSFRRARSALRGRGVHFHSTFKGSLLKPVTSGEPWISRQGRRRDRSLLALVLQAAINSGSLRLIQSRHRKPFPYYYTKLEITEAVYSSAKAPIQAYNLALGY